MQGLAEMPGSLIGTQRARPGQSRPGRHDGRAARPRDRQPPGAVRACCRACSPALRGHGRGGRSLQGSRRTQRFRQAGTALPATSSRGAGGACGFGRARARLLAGSGSGGKRRLGLAQACAVWHRARASRRGRAPGRRSSASATISPPRRGMGRGHERGTRVSASAAAEARASSAALSAVRLVEHALCDTRLLRSVLQCLLGGQLAVVSRRCGMLYATAHRARLARMQVAGEDHRPGPDASAHPAPRTQRVPGRPPRLRRSTAWRGLPPRPDGELLACLIDRCTKPRRAARPAAPAAQGPACAAAPARPRSGHDLVGGVRAGFHGCAGRPESLFARHAPLRSAQPGVGLATRPTTSARASRRNSPRCAARARARTRSRPVRLLRRDDEPDGRRRSPGRPARPGAPARRYHGGTRASAFSAGGPERPARLGKPGWAARPA